MWLKTRSYNISQKCSNPISAKSRQDVNYMYLNETEKQRPVYPQLQTFQTNAHGAHECCRVYRTTVSPNTLLQQVVLLLRNFFSGGHWLTGRQEILHRYPIWDSTCYKLTLARHIPPAPCIAVAGGWWRPPPTLGQNRSFWLLKRFLIFQGISGDLDVNVLKHITVKILLQIKRYLNSFCE